MNAAQLTYILGKYGFTTNQWISLDGIQLVNLKMVPKLHVDTEKMRFRFNTTTENLEIVYGQTNGVTFTSESGQTSNYTPNTFIRYNMIMSFHSTLTDQGLYGTYYRRPFNSPVNYKTLN